jgi:glycerate-2-kinase
VRQSAVLDSVAQEIIAGVLSACDAGAAVGRAWAWAEARLGRPGGAGGVGLGGVRLGGVVVVSIGKASAAMASAACERLGPRCVGGVVVVPRGGAGAAGIHPGLEVVEGDHPVPTRASAEAAGRVEAAARGGPEDAAVLVLLSGGASAVVCSPRAPATLEEIAGVTAALLRGGAVIEEINVVRRACETLKGGGLARVARGRSTAARRVVTLAVSDVVTVPESGEVWVIGSGPTVDRGLGEGEMARRVMDRLGLRGRWAGVDACVEERAGAGLSEPAEVAEAFRVVLRNADAVSGVRAAMERAGVRVVGRRDRVMGEAGEFGAELSRVARGLCPGTGAVFGGETTVRVGSARGTGGRNLEAALAAAVGIEGVDGARVLTLATDGRDGPTDAAGAVVNGSSVAAMRAAGVKVERALREHDSLRALDACGAVVRTGATGTNVCDVAAVWRV